MQIKRETASGNLSDQSLESLGLEVTEAVGMDVTVAVTRETRIDGAPDVTKDTVTYTCDGTPDEGLLDAAIAAHPTTASGLGESLAMTKGTSYTLDELVVGVGDVLYLDVRFLGALGNVNDARCGALDEYVVVHRETTGDVKISGRPEGASPGNIPGLDIKVTGTASTVLVELCSMKTGTLTVFESEVVVKGRGRLPA
jgi:hypothetical protein